MENAYACVVSEGMEADDAMAIEQCRAREETVICTRDKDLRMVPGWQYGWECGRQTEYGPELVDEHGRLELIKQKSSWKCSGTGMMFFYAQLLMGDSTDHIPGCKGLGPKKAYDLLINSRDPYDTVCKAYRAAGHDEAYLLEQGQLLWMCRDVHDDGRPVLWQLES
jgi:5'-3' exonuclease